MERFYLTKRSRKFAKIVTLAKDLEKELNWVPECKDGMHNIVEFFQIVSPKQDQFYEITQDLELKNEKQKFVSDLSEFFRRAGRHEHGWNRTKRGEIPNSKNVFINILAPYDEILDTRSVFEHLSRSNNPKGEIDYTLIREHHGRWNEKEFVELKIVNTFMKTKYDLLQKILA